MMWFRRAICALMIVFILIPHPAMAQDADHVVAVARGERAPFDGILFDDDAVAKMKGKLDTAEQTCQVKLDHQNDMSVANSKYTESIYESKLQLCSDTSSARLQARDDEIKILTARLEQAERVKNRNQLYFGGGIIAGIGLTVLAGWAIGQVAP